METKIFKILLGGTVITGIIAFLLISFINRPLEDQDNIKQQVFNQKIWDEYSGRLDRDSPRGAMAIDLKQMLLSKKYTKNDVLTLLGPPEMDQTDKKLSYHLGMWSNNRQATDTLDIFFNESQGIERIEFAQR